MALKQIIHRRAWRGWTATTVCKQGGTSSPNFAKVTCLQCQAAGTGAR